MTLRCKHCGGAVELQSHTSSGDAACERYQCVACSATGTLAFGEYGEQMSGCLTDA